MMPVLIQDFLKHYDHRFQKCLHCDQPTWTLGYMNLLVNNDKIPTTNTLNNTNRLLALHLHFLIVHTEFVPDVNNLVFLHRVQIHAVHVQPHHYSCVFSLYSK